MNEFTEQSWREKVAGIEHQTTCPTCGQESMFGQIWFAGVEGFRQDCVRCRPVPTPSVWKRLISFIKGENK